MTDQNSSGNECYRPEELFNRYGIKSAAYYKRINFLNIQAKKDSEGKAYLTNEQVEIMDSLHEYINENNKMEGFISNNKNEKTAGTMTVSGRSELTQAKPDSVIEQQIPETQPNFSQGMENLIREAAEIKAQGLAMPDLVKLQLAQQMTFNDLPDDLRDKVTAVREAASPKMQPAGIARQLLAQHRASRQ